MLNLLAIAINFYAISAFAGRYFYTSAEFAFLLYCQYRFSTVRNALCKWRSIRCISYSTTHFSFFCPKIKSKNMNFWWKKYDYAGFLPVSFYITGLQFLLPPLFILNLVCKFKIIHNRRLYLIVKFKYILVLLTGIFKVCKWLIF